jgi:uncharacterized membrane protein
VNKQVNNRLWEIDFLRGIAIILMISFHFIYDLSFFQIISIDLQTISWHLFTYSVGSLFLLLVGISLTISYNRAQKTLTKKQLQMKFIHRGIIIFSLGLIITFATWIYLQGNGTIVFGVLHCIGISVILSYPFLRSRSGTLVFGSICILLGIVLTQFTVDYPWLLWVGFRPNLFYTLDYFPLLPWFGVVLVGIFIGNTLYPQGIRKKQIKNLGAKKSVQGLCFLGKHSLVIYLLHQVIIVGIISLLKIVRVI